MEHYPQSAKRKTWPWIEHLSRQFKDRETFRQTKSQEYLPPKDFNVRTAKGCAPVRRETVANGTTEM